MKSKILLIVAAALVIGIAIVAASCGGGGLYGNTTTSAGGAATTAAPTTAPAGTPSTAGGATTTAGGTGSTAAAGGGAQVSLKNIAIDPTSVTIKAGETVTWTNNDGFAHHLVGDKGEFDSGDMAAGATFTFTFKTAGTVTYHCSIHPEMKGTVIVQ